MGIEVRSLVFDNVLIHQTTQLKEDWQEAQFMMESFTLNEDIYKNGPVFFSVTPDQDDNKIGHFTYYLPVSGTVRLAEESDFRFFESFRLEKALVLRQADEEMDFTTAYQKVKEYAAMNKIALEDTYYCILLEVYGNYIVDLYVPIKERGVEE